MESSDPEDWPGDFQSTLSESSDQDRWLELHYGARLPVSEIEPKDEPNEDFHGQGEESEGEKESAHSDVDTICSEYLKDAHMEYPTTYFSGSHDRAQLTAFQQIHAYARRQAKAIRDNHERLSQWCSEQCNQH